MHLILAVIPKQIQAQEDKNAIQHHTVSPKPLAQAEGSRSGEPGELRRASLRSGETWNKENRNHCGISLKRDPSRLGEWFARSKVERVAWATIRAIWPRWVLVCLA